MTQGIVHVYPPTGNPVAVGAGDHLVLKFAV
ncbi:hypothetical protein [uncultured Zoogloea sp.]